MHALIWVIYKNKKNEHNPQDDIVLNLEKQFDHFIKSIGQIFTWNFSFISKNLENILFLIGGGKFSNQKVMCVCVLKDGIVDVDSIQFI